MELTDEQRAVLTADGHILVTGGPGSGKTTIAILKAAQFAKHSLRSGQKVLFLSFARATVSRVMEAIEHEQKIPREQKKLIEVETYHQFFWRILKTHGYLVGLPRKLSILPPPNEAIALSAIRSEYPADVKLSEAEKIEKCQKENDKRLKLACDEGCICFDLFAQYTGKIIHGSVRIRKLISSMHPIIILDEFQDTDADQWYVVKGLGQFSIMLALADPEQRIYEWKGADPERLNHFKDAFNPTEIALGSDNHRSAGTEIVLFGNDILRGKFRSGAYAGVTCQAYEANPNQAWTSLVTTILKVRKRLVNGNRKNWSLAILVPTKKMTRLVSDVLRSPPFGLPEIFHTAVIEMEAAILGAEVIAFLMQPDIDGSHFQKFIELLCNYFQGKGGDTPTKGNLQEARRIQDSYDEYRVRNLCRKAIRANSILVATLTVYEQTRKAVFIGDPDKDWCVIRSILEQGSCPRLRDIAEEVRNLRLLNRGTPLRDALSRNWRDNGAYTRALAIIQRAFAQMHFSTTYKPETGVVVMNMHKAKGKQFDEVIIFEGWPKRIKGRIVANPDRIVGANSRSNDKSQVRQNFRVSVTRGKSGVIVMTPKCDPCVLLVATDDASCQSSVFG